MAEINKVSVKGETYDIRDSGATRTTVIPNNSGEIKTKYRIAKKDHTGGASWYYEICKLPKNDTGNYASAIISGRIGGWESGNMSYINALIWNRGTPGLAITSIGGTATAARTIWDICDLVLYTNSDGTATLYVKCAGYFTFDLDLELFQSTANITYSGNKLTSVPGTLNNSASATTSRMELINGELFVSGTKMSKSNHSHDVSIAASSGTNELTLAHGTKYALTAGGQSFIFTMPSDNNSHYTKYLQIKGNGTEAIKYTQDSDKSLNLKPGNNVSISAASGEITISATDTNTWRPIGTGANDAAAGNHTHTTNSTFYLDNNNYVHATGFYAQSDKRLKENIKEFNPQKSILDLPVVEFDYIETKSHNIGCIAQDLQEICPEIVNETEEGYLSIEEDKLVYLLLLEVKKLKAETEILKNKLEKQSN